MRQHANSLTESPNKSPASPGPDLAFLRLMPCSLVDRRLLRCIVQHRLTFIPVLDMFSASFKWRHVAWVACCRRFRSLSPPPRLRPRQIETDAGADGPCGACGPGHVGRAQIGTPGVGRAIERRAEVNWPARSPPPGFGLCMWLSSGRKLLL